MKPRDVGVFILLGGLVGEALTEHKPYWVESPHNHVEFPEGTTDNISQISWDSSANTNTASNLYFYESIVGQK